MSSLLINQISRCCICGDRAYRIYPVCKNHRTEDPPSSKPESERMAAFKHCETVAKLFLGLYGFDSSKETLKKMTIKRLRKNWELNSTESLQLAEAAKALLTLSILPHGK